MQTKAIAGPGIKLKGGYGAVQVHLRDRAIAITRQLADVRKIYYLQPPTGTEIGIA